MDSFPYCSRSVHNSGAEYEFRHRFHHVVQIQLVSPFLFDVNYQSEHVQHWMKEADLLPLDRYDKEEQADVVKTRVKLCITVYIALMRKFRWEPIVSSNNEMVCNTLKWLNNVRPTLDDLISKSKSHWKWMQEICEEVNTGSEKEVVALLLTCLHIMMTRDKIIEKYDRMCTELDKECDKSKTEANSRLQNADFQGAISSFSHGLLTHHFSYEMYANRARCYIEVKEPKLAEMDAIRAVFLKCDFCKGYALLLTSLEDQGCLDRASCVGKEGLVRCASIGIENCDFINLSDLVLGINKKVETLCRVGENVGEKVPNLIGDTTEEEDESEKENVLNPQINIDDKPTKSVTVMVDLDRDLDRLAEQSGDKQNGDAKNCDAKNGDAKNGDEEDESKPLSNAEISNETKLNCKTNKSPDKKLTKNGDKFVKHKMWQTMVFEASTNLVNQHFKLASQLYAEALKFLRENPIQEFVKEMEIILIKYAYGMACVETRCREEMLNSIVVFEEILNKHSHVMFPLVYYGLTYSYFKQNRFKEALRIAKKGLENCKNMLIGLLTWPQIDKNIPESASGKFKVKLEKLIDICQSPPQPDAVCRYVKCSGHFKNEIYLTDPDCKGFVKATCDEECSLQYHYNCWKSIKEEIKIFNDKEFLNTTCLTPDCPGGLVEVVYIDCKGEVAKRFKSNTWNKGGCFKQKRPRLGKKSSHKDKKKKKLDDVLKDENCKQDQEDDEQYPEYETFESIAATIFDVKPTPEVNSPVKMPVFPPENVTLTVLKKVDEPDEPVRKVEKHRERKKEKKKQVLKLNEFFADEEEEEVELKQGEKSKKRKRKKKLNNQIAEVESASRHSSESDPDRTSSVSREMVEDELAALSRESIVSESIKKILFDCMKIFLKETGRLQTDDIRLIEELTKLPIDVQEYIADIGGIQELLKKSDDFVVYDDIICLTEHFTGDFTPVDPPRTRSAADQWATLDTINENSEPHGKTSTSSEFEWIEAKRRHKGTKSQINCSTSSDARSSNENVATRAPKHNLFPWVPMKVPPMDDMSNVSSEDLNVDSMSEEMVHERVLERNKGLRRAGDAVVERKAVENVEVKKNEVVNVESKRSESAVDTCSSSCGQSAGQFYTNLQKLWKFVSKFSDKGQGKMLKLVLELIIKEKILERFSPNPENVDRARQTFMFAIDALSDTAECGAQTNVEINPLAQKFEEVQLENIELSKQVKEHEDLIAYLLNTKRQKWEEEKRELEKKMEALTINLRTVDEAKHELEFANTKLEEELLKLKEKAANPSPICTAELQTHPAVSRTETRCSSAPNASRSRDQTLKIPQQSSTSQNSVLPLRKTSQIVSMQQGGNPKNSFEKLMAALQCSFPNVDHDELKGYVQQLRSHCANNRLSGLTIDQIVKEISMMIRMKSSRKVAAGQQVAVIGGMGLERISKPGNPWSNVNTTLSDWKKPDEDEEPCVICHEEFKEFDKLCTLQCHHRFHESCIKAWFKQESTCPTCRAHSLLPDEFPCLK